MSHYFRVLSNTICVSFLFLVFSPSISVTAFGQEKQNQTISIKGIVVAKQKYSFDVDSNGKRYRVRLVDGSQIALFLNRPFFNWKEGKVYVDAIQPEVKIQVKPKKKKKKKQQPQKPERTGFLFPSKELYLIAKFRNPKHMERIMGESEKRINLYVIGPEKLPGHVPTEAEPYIAGKLIPPADDQPLKLDMDESSIPIHLGFQNASMTGFSINDLNENQTQVSLSGRLDPTFGEIMAISVGFEPIKNAQNKKKKN